MAALTLGADAQAVMDSIYFAVIRDFNGMMLAGQAREDLSAGELAALYYVRTVLAIREGDVRRAGERAAMASFYSRCPVIAFGAADFGL